MEETHSKELLDATFDKFIIDNGGVANKRNMRRHMDSPGLNLMLFLQQHKTRSPNHTFMKKRC